MKNDFQPSDPDYQTRVKESFDQQQAMASMGIVLDEILPGMCKLSMPFSKAHTQHNGFIHAGVITSAMDSCCGYAAYSLMPAHSNVLTIEFKVNFLRPAIGEQFEFEAEVIKPGKAVHCAKADAYAISKGNRKLIATMMGTLICHMGE